MIIYRIFLQIKDFMAYYGLRWLTLTIWVACVGIFCFTAGIEATQHKTNSTSALVVGGMEYLPEYRKKPQETGEKSDQNQAFIASKNGTKYYPSGCNSANRIKAENRVYFSSKQQAEARGYSISTSC